MVYLLHFILPLLLGQKLLCVRVVVHVLWLRGVNHGGSCRNAFSVLRIVLGLDALRALDTKAHTPERSVQPSAAERQWRGNPRWGCWSHATVWR